MEMDEFLFDERVLQFLQETGFLMGYNVPLQIEINENIENEQVNPRAECWLSK